MKDNLPRGFEYIKLFFVLVVIASFINLIFAFVNTPLKVLFLNILSGGFFGLIGGIIFMVLSIILGILYLNKRYLGLKIAWYSSLIYFIIVFIFQLVNILLFKLISVIFMLISAYVIYYIITNRKYFNK